jgi:hypothetical protein
LHGLFAEREARLDMARAALNEAIQTRVEELSLTGPDFDSFLEVLSDTNYATEITDKINLENHFSGFEHIFEAIAVTGTDTVQIEGFSDEKLIHYLVPGGRQMASYNIRSHHVTMHALDIIEDFLGGGWTMISARQMMLCGLNASCGSCYVYDAVTERSSKRASLKYGGRSSHAVAFIERTVFIFGGHGEHIGNPTNICEEYSVNGEDVWSSLIDLPFASTHMSSAILKDEVYLTGFQASKIVRFSPKLRIYQPIEVKLRAGLGKGILASQDSLFVFQGNNEARVLSSKGEISTAFETVTSFFSGDNMF